MKPLSTYALPVFSGLLLCLSFPNFLHNQFHWFTNVVAWFALVPLLFSLQGAKPGPAFRRGYLAGLVFFLGSTYWINYVKPMGWAAPAGWLVLGAYLAMYPALFSCAAAWGANRKLPLAPLWLAALWTVLEYARETLFTGFPWVSLGSSQYLNPLVLPVAGAAGIYGLHFLVALGNAVVFEGMRGREGKARQMLSAGLAAVFLLALGLATAPSDAAGQPLVKVAVIQGNIDQDQAWTPAYRAGLVANYLDLMEQASAQKPVLMIWPEATLPGLFSDNAVEVKSLEAFALKHGTDLMVSGYSYDTRLMGYTNCSVLISPKDGKADYAVYAKQHLVPFGEFVPFRRWFTFIDKAVQRFGVEDLAPGSGPVVFSTRAGGVAPLICYEGIFADLSRQACQKGAQALAIQTFDTWYGDSAAPYQHVALAVFRAVEQGRWIARAGATGISCFISPHGRILNTVPLNTRGFAVADIWASDRASLYQALGDWFPGLCLIFCLGLAIRGLKPPNWAKKGRAK